jgi:hypothetical protein
MTDAASPGRNSVTEKIIRETARSVVRIKIGRAHV